MKSRNNLPLMSSIGANGKFCFDYYSVDSAPDNYTHFYSFTEKANCLDLLMRDKHLFGHTAYNYILSRIEVSAPVPLIITYDRTRCRIILVAGARRRALGLSVRIQGFPTRL